MKKLTYIFILILLTTRCNDKIKPKEEELKKYPWMEMFTPGRMDFEGLEHNLDLGEYSFSFKTSYSSIITFFRIVDSNAVNNQWEIIRETLSIREYKKRSTIYDSSKGFDFVELTFNPDKNRIIFKYVTNRPSTQL